MSNKVDIGKVQTTGYGVGPAQVTGGTSVQVGPASIDPGQGQPQGGGQPPTGNAVVSFADFYRATGGDAVKAEMMIPGITLRQGAKLLKMGPDGKPTVELKTVEAMAAYDKLTREQLTAQSARARGGPAGAAEPEYIPLDKGTKADEATYPGIESAQMGYLPYLQQDEKGHLVRDPQGRAMIMNPAHPNTQKRTKETAERLQGAKAKWDELRQVQQQNQSPTAGQAVAEDGP